MGMSFKLVRPKRRRSKARRRRNSLVIGAHRAKSWVPSGATGKMIPPGGYISDKYGIASHGRKKKAKRKSNPGRRRRARASRKPTIRRRRRRVSRAIVVVKPVRRRRRRRASSKAVAPRRRRRRAVARKNNPGRRRRRHARRRRNSGMVVIRRRRRRHARRHGGFALRRRNPGGFIGTFKDIFTFGTAKDVVAGTVGLSVSLWGPKLLGHLVWAPLGRGFGGVATSVVSVGVVSALVGKVSPTAGRAVLAGGLLGAFAGLISAISCGMRQQALPFESGLLACALPTMPAKTPAQAFAETLIASGIPPAQAMAQAKAMGMKDYVSGMSGYGGGNTAGVDRLLSGEQAFRRSAGVNDYAQYSAPASSAGMDSSSESF